MTEQEMREGLSVVALHKQFTNWFSGQQITTVSEDSLDLMWVTWQAATRQAEERERAAWTAGIHAGIEIGRNNQRIDAAKAAEPVVWRWKWPGYQWVYEEHRPDEQEGKIVEPLYTHPPCAQANPSDADIEEIAQANGIQKSDEHWGPRYYTELGSDLFRFARAVLVRYGSAQADADKCDSKTVLAYAPQFPNCETPEPSLRTLIYLYYQEFFDEQEYQSLAERYIAGLAGFLDRAEAKKGGAA